MSSNVTHLHTCVTQLQSRPVNKMEVGLEAKQSFDDQWDKKRRVLQVKQKDELQSLVREKDRSCNAAIAEIEEQCKDIGNIPPEIKGTAVQEINKVYAPQFEELNERHEEERIAQARSYARALCQNFRASADDQMQSASLPASSDQDRPPNSHSLTNNLHPQAVIPQQVSSRIIAPPVSTPPSSIDQTSPMSTTAVNSLSHSGSSDTGATCTRTLRRESVNEVEQLIFRYQTKRYDALSAVLSNQHPPGKVRINTDFDGPPTPAPTLSAVEDCSRTISFDEVYQNGQAKYKHKIVEEPRSSGKWYIFMCQEHGVHFKLKPIAGAAKHLDSGWHGNIGRKYALALEKLGYLVIGCNRQLADMNNRVVEDAFKVHNYKPLNLCADPKALLKESKKEGTSPAVDETTKTREIARDPPQTLECFSQSKVAIITNPKPFHVYLARWSESGVGPGRLWPVLILGWDDLSPGGLEGEQLVGTGLLRTEAEPPECYIYKSNCIVGWKSEYEDGGPKVEEREFPVMFFDAKQHTGWVPAKDLQKFPLQKQWPKMDRKPTAKAVGQARDWILHFLEKDEFASWEAFLQAKGLDETDQRAVDGSENSQQMEDDWDSHGFTWTRQALTPPEDDTDASDSTTTTGSEVADEEADLCNLRQTAGEIPGDEDYLGSDADSTMETENEEVSETQNSLGERPWEWYHLRTRRSASYTVPRTDSETSESEDSSPNLASAIVEGMASARHLSSQATSSTEPQSEEALIIGEEALHDNVTLTDSASVTQDMMIQNSEPTSDSTIRSQSPSQPISCDANTTAPGYVGPPDPEYSPPAQLSSISQDGQTILETTTDSPRGTKRTRSEDDLEAGMTALVEDEIAKKARIDVGPVAVHEEGIPHLDAKEVSEAGGDKPTTNMENDPELEAREPVISHFMARQPQSTAAFEIKHYKRGPVSWTMSDEAVGLELYFGEDDKEVGTIGGAVEIRISATELKKFKMEEIPGSNGNRLVTLISKDETEGPIMMAFHKSKGSKVEPGRIQASKLDRWLRGANPDIRWIY
ncbi:hypothetical protein F5Y16DRAFT_100696 [Xylariaceae sp. FL0255]|nr:hypothetical protein F5Y16DRAFT_100696 [Xylariaceae sp. FL0255]